MPQPKTTEKVAVQSNGHAPGSFSAPRPRYRWVECDVPDLLGADGESFRAEIRVSLTGQQLLDISAPTMGWADLCALLAPMVHDWNLPDPPPAEAGPSALLGLDADLLEWLWLAIRASRFGGEERKNLLRLVTQSGGEQAEETPENE
jgi:hypothetical protein